MQEVTAELFSTLLTLLFLAIPLGIFIWFITALVLFLKTPKDAPKRPKYRTNLIIASIFFGILVGLFLLLICLLMYGVAHM